jgi:OmpA-like transmembrane domain
MASIPAKDGYRILDYLAVEVSYLDLGTLRTHEVLSLPSIPPDTLGLKQELRTNGAAISIQGILPVRHHWDVFVRVGLLSADQELSVSSEGSTLNLSVQLANEKQRLNTALLGAGVQYNWATWSARLEFQRFNEMEFADHRSTLPERAVSPVTLGAASWDIRVPKTGDLFGERQAGAVNGLYVAHVSA